MDDRQFKELDASLREITEAIDAVVKRLEDLDSINDTLLEISDSLKAIAEAKGDD